MTAEKYSVNQACAAAGLAFAFLIAGMLAALYRLTGNLAVL